MFYTAQGKLSFVSNQQNIYDHIASVWSLIGFLQKKNRQNSPYQWLVSGGICKILPNLELLVSLKVLPGFLKSQSDISIIKSRSRYLEEFCKKVILKIFKKLQMEHLRKISNFCLKRGILQKLHTVIDVFPGTFYFQVAFLQNTSG